MNILFSALLIGSVAIAAVLGHLPELGDATISSARNAVTLALSLLAQLTLWLGLLGILRASGAIERLADRLAPWLQHIFPDVPPRHPAMEAILLNLAANFLGLGNAATPMGLKAMRELEKLNPRPGVATDAMIVFLALNTTGVVLLPITALAVRSQLGAQVPGAFIIPTFAASLTTTIAAVTLALVLSKKTSAREQRTGGSPWVAFAGLGFAALVVFAMYQALRAVAPATLQNAGQSLLALIVAAIALYGIIRRVKLFDTFVASGKEALTTVAGLLPYLTGMLVAIGMLRASGAFELFAAVGSPLERLTGFPKEALPMALLRPFSGSGSLALMSDILKAQGPDSFVGLLVSTMYGGSETTFYVLALYFGAVQVTRLRYAIFVGLFSDVIAPISALLFCRLFSG